MGRGYSWPGALLLCVVIVMVAMAPRAHAQVTYKAWKLTGTNFHVDSSIPAGKSGYDNGIIKVLSKHADSRGGWIDVQVTDPSSTPTPREYRFSWIFTEDVTYIYLKRPEIVQLTITPDAAASASGYNPYFSTAMGGKGADMNLELDETADRYYLRNADHRSNLRKFGVALNTYSDFSFTLKISGLTTAAYNLYDIDYNYSGVQSGAPTPVSPQAPPTVPPATPAPSTPRPPTPKPTSLPTPRPATPAPAPTPRPPAPSFPAEPCLDPHAQACIQKWEQLYLAMLNKAGPGSWSFSPYGTLVGTSPTASVASAGPPDGWVEQYHSNAYCFVWANYQNAHTDPRFGGQLPSLASYVKNCYSGSTGGSPGTASPGTSSTGPVSTGPGSTGPGSTGPGMGPGTSGPGGGTMPSTTSMALWATDVKVVAGGTVVVPVWLLNGANVGNANYTVAYNPAVAIPSESPVAGGMLSGSIFSANSKESGLIRLGFANTTGLNGTGVVANLAFQAVGAPGTSTPLTLALSKSTDPSGNALTIALINGSITIVNQNGMLPGDCDGDGVLTAADAQCALDMSVGLIPVNLNMDMDGDGQVTARDAEIILQKVVQALSAPTP